MAARNGVNVTAQVALYRQWDAALDPLEKHRFSSLRRVLLPILIMHRTILASHAFNAFWELWVLCFGSLCHSIMKINRIIPYK